MAMKTDFEEAAFISSPFVDEIANQGDKNVEGLRRDEEALAAEFKGFKPFLNLINPIAGGAALQRKKELRERIKNRKTAQRLRDQRE